jgi:membrane-bound lytic murein transglycosylase B
MRTAALPYPARTAGTILRTLRLTEVLAAVVLILPMAGKALAASPSAWVDGFWPTAKAAGITRATYTRALGNFAPDPDVIKNASSQAEFTMKIWDYLDQMVSDDRISEGRAALAQYSDLLSRIEARYGVDREVIVAIWGMESHYGSVLKRPSLVKNTIRSLATLAYSGGRLSSFGRKQLIAALKIVQRGDVSPEGMTGSWAGAMGHTQFIPTTFEAYGVDFDGDGHRNIWTSPVDALASTANYLHKAGWHHGQTWGYEVVVPAGVKATSERSLAAWAKLGVVRVGGKGYPRPGDKASLYRPNGAHGPSFLLLPNFKVIKRYNNSNFYALAVGHLADRIAGYGDFVAQWPAHEKPLSQDERERMQLLLTMLGLYDGDIDGVLGSGSRAAIKTFQQSVGLTPDGVGTRRLLQRLEEGG